MYLSGWKGRRKEGRGGEKREGGTGTEDRAGGHFGSPEITTNIQ